VEVLGVDDRRDRLDERDDLVAAAEPPLEALRRVGHLEHGVLRQELALDLEVPAVDGVDVPLDDRHVALA
jgi:hypothetical protein